MSNKQQNNLEAYLRSIDVGLDAESASRIEHFMPTEKSVHLINFMMGEQTDRVSIIVAPYGTGKSLVASYALHMIENRPESNPILKTISSRMREVSTVLAKETSKRLKKSENRGIVIPLSGPVSELHTEIYNSANQALQRFKLGRKAKALYSSKPSSPEELPKYLNVLQAKLEEWGFDRIAIIWDEFGKHLEFLIQEGRTNQLFHVQKLAEFVPRSSLPMSFSAILHMGFLHYAGTLSQSARSEWRKIEGRFSQFNYIDDSKHLYSLIARLVKMKKSVSAPTKSRIDKWAKICRTHNLFREFNDAELSELIKSSHPFTPAALHLLPRLTGRIAQNERTLFHFLNNWDGESDIRPTELYDYFSPQLKADITTGGTHRVWLETNSALQKVDGNDTDEAILKSASLFGLGLDGKSAGASLNLLRQSWRRFNDFEKHTPCPVKALIKRKLLLYRQYKDEVAVWHGSDVDLRGHLESEKAQRGTSFDLVPFLNKQTPPPFLKPLAYNTEFYVRRYFSGEFKAVTNSDDFDWDSLNEKVSGDGHVIYLLPDNPEQMEQAKIIATRCEDPLTVMVVPSEPLPLGEVALELQCLFTMQKDQDLIASDPLALEEISQITSDTEAHLHNLVKRCTEPTASHSTWYYRGNAKNLKSHEELRDFLSDICQQVYSLTPKLNNELINKKKPSAVVVNSRKKLVMGILERYGSHDLGLPLTTPDGSMLRTLLVNTGLYAEQNDGSWGFIDNKDSSIQNEGLSEVWDNIVDFLSTPSGKPKQLRSLYNKLTLPPIGLREGLIPILLASGIRAFGGMTAIRKNGRQIEDLLPTTIEDMSRNPDQYEFEPVNITSKQKNILVAFLDAFGSLNIKLTTTNMLRLAGEVTAEWKDSLPLNASNKQFEDELLNSFRDVLFATYDYVDFLTEVLPSWIEINKVNIKKLKVIFSQYKEQLDNADLLYYDQIANSLKTALGFTGNSTLAESANAHASMFPDKFIAELPNELATQFLRRLRFKFADDEKLCRSIAQLFTEKRVR